jgi:homoserine dehydrogenase
MAGQTVLLREKDVTREAVPSNIAILGFGTVGSSVARILADEQLPNLKLVQVFNRNVERKRASWVDPSVQWTQNFQDVLRSNADVVVEVMGGVDPARDWIAALLESGKSVVTANKQLIARHGSELCEAAYRSGSQLLFGASVAGGVPVITALEQGLCGDRLHSICGILNGTCNYILSKMEEGLPFASALQQAQELGYAEADPTDDVEGYDTCAKLVILARIALSADIALEQVSCASISTISPVDFEYARELGCTIRQIGEAEVNGNTAYAAVEPMIVRHDSPLARAKGCENVVITNGKFGGNNAFSGPGAGGNATAVAILSDLLSLPRTRGIQASSRPRPFYAAADYIAPYFLRFVVKDRPGIVANIAAVLARFEINLDAVFQKPGYDKDSLPFVVTVEACSAARLKEALQEISHFDFLLEPALQLRIFGR